MNYNNIWITSDLHLGHGNIMKYCSRTLFMTDEDRKVFEQLEPNTKEYKKFRLSIQSVQNMDRSLINNINSFVNENDLLIHLGDFAFVKNFDQLKKYRDQIFCKNIWHLWGNHDNRKNFLEDGIIFNRTFDSVFCYIFNYNEIYTERELQQENIKINKNKTTKIYLNHYANIIWQDSHKGSYHFYGHSHGNFEEKRKQLIPTWKCMDIGVDCHNYTPVKIDDACSKLDNWVESQLNNISKE